MNHLLRFLLTEKKYDELGKYSSIFYFLRAGEPRWLFARLRWLWGGGWRGRVGNNRVYIQRSL